MIPLRYPPQLMPKLPPHGEEQVAKVRFDGGTPLTLASGISTNAGAAWAPDNSIVFSTREDEVILRVVEGGIPEPITDPRFAEPGFLVFSDAAGSIMAQRLDPRSLKLSGERFRIAELATWRGDGSSEFDISRTGTLEVYVEPFPALGRRFKLTTGGAYAPVWSPDGRRLYFIAFGAGGEVLTVVEVRAGNAFDVGEPESLFDTGPYLGGELNSGYDIHPDGTRFVFVRGGGGGGTETQVVITNALNAGLAAR